MRLWYPEVRVAPDARTVLGHREVKALRRKRDVLGTGLDQRKIDRELALAAARGGELCGSDVDTDRARTAPREPSRDVGGAATELDDVEPVDVPEGVERFLGNAEHAPRDLGGRPGLARPLAREIVVDPRPARAI